MITRLFSRSALHEHADPAQRLLGIAELAPDAPELAALVATDPEPEVRAAAARRSTDFAALVAAWRAEAHADVRVAVTAALVDRLADATAPPGADFLASAECTNAIRSEVARRAADAELRRAAVAAIDNEDVLVDVALGASQAEARLAAAERVAGATALRRLAEAARNKDHGVARLARQRLDALERAVDHANKADTILAELEALAERPGPIVTALVELDRRWAALDLAGHPEKIARADAARRAIQARFNREQEEQRTRSRFERGLRDWLGTLEAPATADHLAALAAELAAWREEAKLWGDADDHAALDTVEQRITAWEVEHQAVAGAEALVVEAEQLAASASIDNAKLPERWQTLDRAIRIPALTRRFEAALMVVEQRRLEQVRAAEQEAGAARQRVHGLLHTAEQALAAGQLQAARAAADEIRGHKPGAGTLPKPTTQRLGRLLQQLTELERWESFGQQNARVQLCDRAEALIGAPPDHAHLAQEVQKLRTEWKTLDAQHAGVPKALWERFDRACEKAYAPAARHFSELAAQRKQARKQREEFVAVAAAHAPTLLGETPDWRGIERWLRETDQAWRDGKLGSVEPAAWKKLDVQLKAAVAPARDALNAARDQAKVQRQALIEEATALGAKPMDRDTLGKVKDLQTRWQEQAKAISLLQRDERTLWDQFRAACDAVFAARQARRKEEDGRRHESRRALEDICASLEQAAAGAAERNDQDLRRLARELGEQWRQKLGRPDPSTQALENRFRSAKAALDAVLAGRSRSRDAAVWQTVAAKEALCEELDRAVAAGVANADVLGPDVLGPDVLGRWEALPALPPAWEKKLLSRRDASGKALQDTAAGDAYRRRLAESGARRVATLLELEMALGLDSPAELQNERLALQVRLLRDRFKGAGDAPENRPGERLIAWCAEPGVIAAGDRERCRRIFAAVERSR